MTWHPISPEKAQKSIGLELILLRANWRAVFSGKSKYPNKNNNSSKTGNSKHSGSYQSWETIVMRRETSLTALAKLLSLEIRSWWGRSRICSNGLRYLGITEATTAMSPPKLASTQNLSCILKRLKKMCPRADGNIGFARWHLRLWGGAWI